MRQGSSSFAIKMFFFLLMSCFYVNVWAAAPDAPEVSSVTGTSSTGYEVTGTGEADTTVMISDDVGAVVASGTVATDNSWIVTIPSGVLLANASMIVTLTNASGDKSNPTFAETPADPPIPPEAPVVTDITGSRAEGYIVNGTGVPGATVIIKNISGESVGEATVAADGQWTMTIVGKLTANEMIFVTQAVGGLTSESAEAKTPADPTPPDAPVVTKITGTSAEGYTVNGTGVPGASVSVKDENGEAVGETTVGEDDKWIVTIVDKLTADETIYVTQTVGGVTSDPTIAKTPYTPDPPDPTDPPAPPVISSPANNSTVSSSTTTFSGIGVPGATVSLFNSTDLSNPIGSVAVASNGSWSVSISLADGSYSVTARQANSTGTSKLAESISFTVSTAAASSLTLSKSANVTHFALPGTPILYTYVISNTGSTVLTNLALVDTPLGAIQCPSTSLNAGTSMTCTARYLTVFADMKQGQITNTALVTALAPNGSTVQAQASVTITLDGEFIRQQTTKAINGFLNARAQLIFTSGPERQRLINRLKPRSQNCKGQPRANFVPGNERMALHASTSLNELCAPASQWDVWAEIAGLYYQQNKASVKRNGDFGIGYLGVDYLLNPSVVFGVLAEGDVLSQNHSSGVLNASGQGWMFGPYLSARLLSDVYLHTRAAWGGSSNDMNVFGLYQDSFKTRRGFYNAELVGDWRHHVWTVSPTLGLSYYNEVQPQFMNELAILIPKQQINLGEVNAGPDFSYQFLTAQNHNVTLRLSVQALYHFAYQAEGACFVNPWAGRIKLGADLRLRSGLTISPMATYEGVGTNAYQAVGGQLQMHMPWD